MRLIVDISDDLYNVIKTDKYGLHKGKMYDIVRNGVPLDSVKAEIEEYSSTVDRAISEDELKIEGMKEAYTDCLKIIDNISKAECGETNE